MEEPEEEPEEEAKEEPEEPKMLIFHVFLYRKRDLDQKMLLW